MLQDGYTSLHLASKHGRVNVFELLLKAGVDANTATSVSHNHEKLIS